MKTKSLLCALAGLGVVLSSCATDSSIAQVEMSSSAGRDSTLAGGILRGVNEYRRSNGLSTLSRHTGLDRLAQQHAEYMMNNRGSFGLHGKNVTHYGFEGRVLAAQRLCNMETIGENVIAGTQVAGDIPSALVKGWVSSSGHRKNMTDDWSATGIGVAVDKDGAVFATQLFGTPTITHSRWAGPSQEW